MTRHDDTVRLRNRVVHGYDDVDYDIVWETVTTDLPPVVEALAGYLSGPGHIR